MQLFSGRKPVSAAYSLVFWVWFSLQLPLKSKNPFSLEKNSLVEGILRVVLELTLPGQARPVGAQAQSEPPSICVRLSSVERP